MAVSSIFTSEPGFTKSKRSIQIKDFKTQLGQIIPRFSGGEGVDTKILEFSPLIDVLKREFKCLICKRLYTPQENFISLQCKFHPGYLTSHLGRKFFTCCMKGENYPPCISCAHVATEESYHFMKKDPVNAVTKVPKILLTSNTIKFSPHLIIDYPEGSFPTDLPDDVVLTEHEKIFKVRMVAP